MKNLLTTTLIIGVFTISLLVRIIGLEVSPQSIGFDEASLGYNAYSILKTGNDEYGTRFPLSLRSFNDFKPALYAYLEIPFIHFLGLNATSTRLPSAIFGALSLLFLLLILKQLTAKPYTVLIGILAFISFLPWRLHFSRVAFEANVSMAFFTVLVWCLINFSKNNYYKIATILFSTLAIYSYHSARVAVPILLFLVIIDPLTFEFKYSLKKLWPLMLVIICYIPLFLEFQASFILTRFGQTNIFSHFYPFTPLELIITENIWLNPLANPIYYLSGILIGHVSSYFSPQNLSLLIYPGVIKSAQAIGSSGMLGFWGGILFIVGVITNLRSLILDKEKRILVYWILAGIAPAAITWEWFYPLRSLNIYPAIDIICGLGLLSSINYFLHIKHKLLRYLGLTIIILITVLTSFYNLINEYNYGAWEISGEFQPGGFKQSAEMLKVLKDSYSTIYLDTSHAQSYEIFWFYMQYPPEKIQRIAAERNKPGVEGPPTINFDNFIFKKLDWPHDKVKSDFAYWTNSEVKEQEIAEVYGASLYKIYDPTGNWVVSIITKD